MKVVLQSWLCSSFYRALLRSRRCSKATIRSSLSSNSPHRRTLFTRQHRVRRPQRLLVIKSHTHFGPKEYRAASTAFASSKIPTATARRIALRLFRGHEATMDIAAPDGSVYLATRNEVRRLQDTEGDGKADRKEQIAFLKTAGDYPHNGLSGLCFDSRGNLYFGMGENLGATYELTASDGTKLTGGGEGGNIFWCTADGKQLRRVATGFWNPFGVCTDIFGRIFAVDNDPDAMPPCRMLHVVEGGDYGYQFRYGRSGRHPFQAWNGQLPGTLPMVSGTGESPCEILSYESDAGCRRVSRQPARVRLGGPSHRRYVLKDKALNRCRATAVRAKAEGFSARQLAVARMASLFAERLGAEGLQPASPSAVWHIRRRKASRSRPQEPRSGIGGRIRPLREGRGREVGSRGRKQSLPANSARGESPHRASLTALIDAGDTGSIKNRSREILAAAASVGSSRCSCRR